MSLSRSVTGREFQRHGLATEKLKYRILNDDDTWRRKIHNIQLVVIGLELVHALSYLNLFAI